METKMMELGMDELEMVNGGTELGGKLTIIATTAGVGVIGGAGAGACLGSIIPGVGTVVGGVVGGVVGAAVGGGITAIKYFFYDD